LICFSTVRSVLWWSCFSLSKRFRWQQLHGIKGTVIELLVAGVGGGDWFLVAEGTAPEWGVTQPDLFSAVLGVHLANKFILYWPGNTAHFPSHVKSIVMGHKGGVSWGWGRSG
jgi:hypothetical protein